jgi:hypothetical protein
LFHGNETNGVLNLASVLKDGSWIIHPLDNDHFRSVRDLTKQRLEATMINHAYMSQFVYITRSHAKDDNCHADDRGHPSLKVCLDESPNEVFYVFL